MNQYWQELIKLLGGFAVLVTALAWLTKSVVTHFLDRDVEKYKSRLASESARELEHFKNLLQLAAKEHEVRFSKLHEKRAEIIADLHSLLYEAHISVSVLELRIKNGDDEATLEQAAKFAYEVCRNAYAFFKKNRLYLSKELSDSINRILSTMEITSVSYPYAGTIRTNALNIWNEQSQQISSIMSHLEQEFRIMLGSEGAKIETLDKAGNSGKISDK
jgi:hypothetical protein